MELTYIANILEAISEYKMTGIGRYIEIDFGRCSGKTRAINAILSTSDEFLVYYPTRNEVACFATSKNKKYIKCVIDMDISSRQNDIHFLDDVNNRTLEVMKQDLDSIKAKVNEFNKLVIRLGSTNV